MKDIVLRFPILRASVKAYKNNLNTHKGYKSFREKRNRLRERNKRIKGLALQIHWISMPNWKRIHKGIRRNNRTK